MKTLVPSRTAAIVIQGTSIVKMDSGAIRWFATETTHPSSFLALSPSHQGDGTPTDQALAQLKQAATSQGIARSPWIIQTAKGQGLPTCLTLMPCLGEKDTWQIHLSAITEKQLPLSDALAEGLYLLLNATTHDIWAVNLHYQVLYFNDTWKKNMKAFFDIDLKVGMDLVHGDGLPEPVRQQWKGYYDRAFAGEKVFERVQYISIQGTIGYYRINVNPIRDKQGKVVGATCCVEDESPLRLAHEERDEHKDMYQLLAENTSDLVAIMSLDGQFIYMSPAIERLTGYTPMEYQQFSTFDNVHPEDHQCLQDGIKQLIKDNKSVSIQYRILHKNGSIVWIESKGTLVQLNEDEAPVIITTSQNITQQKAAEEEIRYRERSLSFIAKHTSQLLSLHSEDEVYALLLAQLKAIYGEKVGILISALHTDTGTFETKQLYVNNKFLERLNKMFNYPLVGLKGDIVEATLAPLQTGQLVQMGLDLGELSDGSIPKAIIRAIEQIIPPYDIWSIGLKEGNTLVGNIHILQFDPEYQLHKRTVETIVGEAASLIAKYRYTDKLKRSEDRFAGVVNALSDIIFTLDTDLKHTGVFGSWVERYGYRSEDIIGKTPAELFDQESGRLHTASAQAALAGEEVKYIWQMLHNGKHLELHVQLTPLFDDQQQVIGILGMGRDITEILEYKRYIEDQNDQLKRIAWIQSHDVRGPLTRLHGLVNLMTEKRYAPEKTEKEMFHLIQKTIQELDSVILDIVQRADKVTHAFVE